MRHFVHNYRHFVRILPTRLPIRDEWTKCLVFWTNGQATHGYPEGKAEANISPQGAQVMALGNNGTLRTNSALREIVNNNQADIIIGTDAAEAFSFTDLNGGLSGDDTIRQFGKNDVLLNYRSIYDGNADNLIDLGSNGLLDIDRAGPKRAGPDQIKLEGLGGGALRYLGDKQGYSVYADASVRLKGLTEGTVNNDSFDAAKGGKAYSFLYDTALGLNLGGDTIRNFGADDRIVTTTKFFDGGNANGTIGTGANGVFDLSGTSVSMRGDDGVANGGQIDIVGVSALYLLSTMSVNGVTYYSYGSTPNTPLPPVNRAPTAPATATLSVQEDGRTTYSVIGASDPDGDTLSYTVAAGDQPRHGTLVAGSQAGSFDYTPNPDFAGEDSFTITISDGKGGTTQQRVTTTVTPVNDAPTAAASVAVTTSEDTATAATRIGATDIDGDTLTYSIKVGSTPAKGSVAFDQRAGTFVYTPNADRNGADAFTIVISDGQGGTTEQRVDLTITPVQDRIANIDLNDIAAGKGGFKIIGQTTFDNAGSSVSDAGDINGDGLADLIIGALGNDANGQNSGIAYVVFGKTDSVTVDLNAVANGTGGFKIAGQAALDNAGSSVSNAGDVNGDGLADLIVGSDSNDANGQNSGAAYVVFGKTDGTTIDLNAVANGTGGFKIAGQAAFDYAGVSVSTAGDVNGDGFTDLIVGAYLNDANGSDSGAAYVVFGKTDGGAIDLNAVANGTGGFKIAGQTATDLAGISVSNAGDVNGDGRADLIVGAYSNDTNGRNSGATYVVFGKKDGGTIDLNAVANGTAGFKISGQAEGDFASNSVSTAGDVNGDGLTDLIVGAFYNDANDQNSGAAYVVFGKTDGTMVDLNTVANGIGGFKIVGQAAFDYAGVSVSHAGDVNGDGLTDLIVGAYDGANGNDSGAAYVVFGKKDGTTIDLNAVANGTGGFKIAGQAGADFAGISVSNAGDVNGDGLVDLIVGATGNDANGNNSGAAYVIYGSSDWLI